MTQTSQATTTEGLTIGWRRLTAITALTAVLVATVGAGALIAGERFLRAPIGGNDVLVFLLLGADQGPMRGGSPIRARADAFHLVFVSSDRNHATFVNIPRDAYVSVPGRGRSRINACLNDGADNCAATVEANFGVAVDYWLLTDFNGLKTAVDRYGGITVDVPRPLTDGGADVGPGRQTLSGSQALAFTRDRKNRPGGDFTRTAAQTTLLQAAHRQLLAERANVGRIAEMVGLVRQTTHTNARPDELLRLGYMAMTIPPDNVANVTAPGAPGRAGAAAVVYLSGTASDIIADAAGDGRVGK